MPTLRILRRFKPMVFLRLNRLHPDTHLLRGYSTASNNFDYWARSLSESYKPGTQLTIAAPSRDEAPIQVQIVKAYQPFTNAVVLLVEPRSSKLLPSRLILKLADRRIWNYWNVDRERDYQLNVRSHFGRDGAKNPLDVNDFSQRPAWMNHLQKWESCVECHNTEHEAYRRLTEAQHLGLVPRFFGPTYIDIEGGGHPSLSRIDGLLIEYIEGRRMSSLRPGISISIEQAEVVSQHVLELGRRLRRYGVTHNDIHVGNVILRYPDNLPVLIDWGLADCSLADLPLEERWNHFTMAQDYHYDIRYLLRYGVYFEGPEEKVIAPEMTAGGVWHRYRTPLSDEEQCRLAKEHDWRFINHTVEDLSWEEREKLYEEDVSVDPHQGLRWRVKKGTKTRLFEDPVPK